MKLKLFITAVIVFYITLIYGYGRYYPLDILKYYAEFKASGCSSCSIKLLDRGAAGLDQIFEEGLIIESGKSGFVKNGRCGENEIQLKSDEKRKVYKKSEDEIIYFPAVVFRFHTESRDMAGIAAHDYSDNKFAAIYDSGNSFTGNIKLIHYENGDGKTFVYDKERHVVQVHCVLVSLKKDK